ncbi:transcription elongation factor S-II [Pancytospora epiphaga]|nr:transcription elongation factor S-II [Pancytospora epiphaga]
MTDIISAVREGNIDIIKNYINRLKSCEGDKITELLKNAQSEEVASAIREAFETKMSTVKETDKKGRSGFNLSVSEDLEEEITEEVALKKHSGTNPKVEKAAHMFLSAFKENIKKIKYSRAVSLSFEIGDYIFQNKADVFPKTVRSKTHNLKGNTKLCERVYSSELTVAEFVEMSISDMKSDELKSIDDEAMRDSLLASQAAKAASETDMFQCSRCKERKCTYSQLQTRSCDEPMTTFVHCTVCGHRWRF